MSILIVDDNAMNARILEFNLSKNGYDTIVVESGPEALEALETMPEIQLVITDIMMPEMDGLALLAKIKDQPELKNIPVIMCTALSNVETVRKAAKAGCRHYIIKPINAVQLRQKVREILGSEETVLKDRSKVLSDLGIDNDLYDELGRAFTILVGQTIEALEKAKGTDALADNSVNLMNLLESASLMGAERMARILDAVFSPHKGNPDPSLLLRELKALHNSLAWKNDKRPAATGVTTEEKNDAKAQNKASVGTPETEPSAVSDIPA